jgi:hypothetical protein
MAAFFDKLTGRSPKKPEPQGLSAAELARADVQYKAMLQTIQRTMSEMLRQDSDKDSLYGALSSEPGRLYLLNYALKIAASADLSKDATFGMNMGLFYAMFGETDGQRLWKAACDDLVNLNEQDSRGRASPTAMHLYRQGAEDAQQP